MASVPFDASLGGHLYLAPPDMSGGYDRASSESSASSPLGYNVSSRLQHNISPGPFIDTPNQGQGFDNLYGASSYLAYSSFPMQYPMPTENLAPVAMIPVELDIEGIYEEHDRRRRKSANDKPVSSHVHSRRRAQNRASQRAFRDRKEKHMRELEQQLGELEGRHNDLSRSYESLQLEYTSVKQELDKLRREKQEKGHHGKDWDSNKEGSDPTLFDVSEFCFEEDDEGDGRP